MAKGIEMGIGVDTKAFKQAVELGMIDPIENAVEALDDLGRARGPERLEDGLRDAQRATERLEKETKETAETIEREYRDSYRKMKNSADTAMSGASGGVQTFKEEALSNFSEVTSSFDGSMESITDLAQGTFGGLAVLGGAAGLAAGAAAIGVGLIGEALTEVGDITEENKQKASEWAQSFIEAGGKILTTSQLLANQLAITTDPEQYELAKTNAKDWGVSVGLAVNAMAGDTHALAEVQGSLSTRLAEANRLLAEQETQVDSNAGAAYDLADATKRGQQALDDINNSMALGAEQADVYSESLRLTAQNTAGATKAVDEFGDSVYSLPDGTKIYIDAETGKATQNVDDIEKRIYGMPATAKVVVDLDTTEADRKWAVFLSTPRKATVQTDFEKTYGRKVL